MVIVLFMLMVSSRKRSITTNMFEINNQQVFINQENGNRQDNLFYCETITFVKAV